MNQPVSTDLGVTRRTLVGGSVALTTLVASGALTGAADAAPKRVPRVAVLSETVTGRPAVKRRADAVAAGLAIGLGVRHPRILRAEASTSTEELTAAVKGLAGQGAQVLVAAFSTPTAARLANICADHQLALVVANAGAHVVDERTTAAAPAALHVSTQHWAAAMSAGGWARRTYGRRMHIVVAAPDAGYDSVYALQRGFAVAGGRVVGTTLTHGATGLEGLVTEVRATQPDVVGVCATGTRAAEILRALRAANLKLPVILDPLSMESGTLSALGGQARGLHLVAARIDPERHRTLARALRSRGQGAVDAYSILGYDTGLLITAGARRLGSRTWAKLPAVLAGRSVAGVRGIQKVHPRLGTVSVPLAVYKVKRVDGTSKLKAIASRPRIAGDRATATVLRGRTASGYVNEYLTI
ncbi:ABC transporter substrate-binding protein [Nocardioides sp. Bht2]|uniref:ABC transporter substrate-binding protein n=1 Tax=Nocardioides sp. Bht2 TaxID=3392297 RepID=UPI0039B512BE